MESIWIFSRTLLFLLKWHSGWKECIHFVCAATDTAPEQWTLYSAGDPFPSFRFGHITDGNFRSYMSQHISMPFKNAATPLCQHSSYWRLHTLSWLSRTNWSWSAKQSTRWPRCPSYIASRVSFGSHVCSI